MSYSEGFRSGFNAGYAKGTKFVDELEAQIANLAIDKSTLMDRMGDTEKVLFSIATGNGLPPGFGVEHDCVAFRSRAYRRTMPVSQARLGIDPDCFGGKEVVFTKAELLEAIENIRKDCR